jgi:hypothetical protein
MRLRLSLCVAAVVLSFLRPAAGDVVISLNDLGAPGIEVIIADNAPAGTMTALGPSTHADADPALGQVGVPVGVTAGNFNIDPTTTGFGIGGGSENALIDLLLFADSNAPGQLEAMVTWTDITQDGPEHGIIGNIGGISFPDAGPGDVSYQIAIDPGNGAFSFPSGSTFGPVSIGGGAFGTSGTAFGTVTGPFSLSESITLTFSDAGQFMGFDAQAMIHNPEPTSLLLWTVAAGVAFGFARRKSRQSRRPVESGNAA